MTPAAQESLLKHVDFLVEKYGKERSSLLPVLQDIQSKWGGVPDAAMQKAADALGLHPSEVYGVVTFYSFLNVERKGRFVIRLCRTACCDMAGKKAVARQLRNELGIDFGQTTPDGRFTLEWTNCLGMCDQGPALMVNGRVFTKVAPEKAHEILEECGRVFGPHATQEEASKA